MHAEPGRPRGGPIAGVVRIWDAWGELAPEQRLAATAALGLWASMLLPWYTKSFFQTVNTSPRPASTTITALGGFSFVEAAVLLVSAAVLTLLFARAERRAFHLPGGDGLVIMLGGIWTAVLIFYRMLDKPSSTGTASAVVTTGITWGIFVALAAAIALAYSGARVRTAHRPEPSLAEDPTVAPEVAVEAQRVEPTRRHPRDDQLTTQAIYRGTGSGGHQGAEQLTFEVPPEERDPFS